MSEPFEVTKCPVTGDLVIVNIDKSLKKEEFGHTIEALDENLMSPSFWQF